MRGVSQAQCFSLITVLSAAAVTGYPGRCRLTDTAAVFGVAVKEIPCVNRDLQGTEVYVAIQITPYSRVLLEGLNVPQLVKKFLRILLKQKVHHRVHNVRLSGATPIRTTTSYLLSLGSTLILFSHLRLGFTREPFFFEFPDKNSVCISLVPPTCHMPRSYCYS